MVASVTETAAQTLNAGTTVLQLVPELQTGADERAALEIASAIVAAGGCALVASGGGRLEQRFRSMGAEVITIPFARQGFWARQQQARAVTRLCVDRRVGLIHAHAAGPAWAGLVAARRLSLPLVTSFSENIAKGFFARRAQAVLTRGDRVIAVSESVARQVAARFPTVGPMLVIPRGVDTELFMAGAVPRTRLIQLADRWQLGDDPRPIILLPGRLSRSKGQHQAIEAAAKLKAQRGNDFLLVLAGAGDPAFIAELTTLVHKHQLHDVVRLTGHCDDMPAAYGLASYVLSSAADPDAFGRSLIEAQAMGRPVIAPAHGSATETVADGMTGWFYQPGDIADLSRVLGLALATDESHRAHMGAAGTARAKQLFSVARMQAAVLTAYEDLLGQPFPNRS